MKIAFLGNSLVAGSYGGSFVNEVAIHLPQHNILNAGVNGSTVLNLLQRLDNVLEQQPDIVVISCGGNDAISYSQPETRRFYERAMYVPDGIVSPERFIVAFRDLLTRLQLAQVMPYVILPPIEHNRVVVSTLRDYNRMMAEACATFNLPTLDLMSALVPDHIPDRPPLTQATINLIGQRVRSGWNDYETERERGGFTYSFDGLHFTPETARRVGAMVVDFLNV
ncbi:MAG: SGNH/GDSL hydrolase family protein [Anaerolineae bacterium]